jgi:hypothetical protein
MAPKGVSTAQLLMEIKNNSLYSAQGYAKEQLFWKGFSPRCWWKWSNGGMIWTGEAEVRGGGGGGVGADPVALCMTQFFHGPVWYQNHGLRRNSLKIKRLLTNTWLCFFLPRTWQRTQILENPLLTFANMYGRRGCWTAVCGGVHGGDSNIFGGV